MNVIALSTDIAAARDKIMDNIRENHPVFIIPVDCKVFEYIPKLELKEKVQSRMRICKELKINVLLKKRGEKTGTPYQLLSELLKAIDEKEECEVIVCGDVNVSEKEAAEVRYQLCELIQQFLYINLQLSIVHVCTEKEAKDNEKIRVFEHSIEKHKAAVAESIAHVNGLEDDSKNHKTTILKRLHSIQGFIAETQNNELKIAVAATKKSGKSVIVNSMIENEIAPTSLELATPNNCIYTTCSDGEFHLKYKGKEYANKDAEAMRSRLNTIFKEAEKDHKNGLGIPDMELQYPSCKNGFSTYTIYDTPGPNLAAATAHKEAAKRGVDAADVIIFTIDYSQYLTDDEYNYLKEVWQMCQKKGKNYSLILNVNKLDLRYDDGSDKSVVRIVDFIRNKLIETGKTEGIDFRGCVVIGTSALTYFNALTAPTLKCPNDDGDCSCLYEDFSMDAMDDCIDAYDDSETAVSVDYEKRAMSTLQQLKGMIDNAKIWHKQKITSVQEMEEFSGMPNLLSYVEYISTQKARNEKVNNLIFKIDSEYKAIMNLFHIEELMQRLKENKELYEKAKKILMEFEAAVKAILDPEYNDLYGENYMAIYTKFQDKRSVYLRELTQKRPISLFEIKKMYENEVDAQLGLDAVLKEVTEQRVETLLTRELQKTYDTDESVVLKIDVVCDDYTRKLSQVCKDGMSKYVSVRKEELGKRLEEEQRAISATLSYIWEERLNKLRSIVTEYSDKLTTECAEQLNIEVPEFQIVFEQGICMNSAGISNLNVATINKMISEAMHESNRFYDGKTDGLIGFFRKMFGAEKKITLGNVLKIYQSKKIAIDLQAVYKKNGTLEQYLETSVCSPLKNAMSEFIKDMMGEIRMLDNNIQSATEQIKTSIDETGKYEQNIKDLEKEKRLMEELKLALQFFSNSWNEVMQG